MSHFNISILNTCTSLEPNILLLHTSPTFLLAMDQYTVGEFQSCARKAIKLQPHHLSKAILGSQNFVPSTNVAKSSPCCVTLTGCDTDKSNSHWQPPYHLPLNITPSPLGHSQKTRWRLRVLSSGYSLPMAYSKVTGDPQLLCDILLL